MTLQRRQGLTPGTFRVPVPPLDPSGTRVPRNAPRAWNSTLTRSRGFQPGGTAGGRTLARTTTLKTATRNPNGPTDEVRGLVLERDDYMCQCGCGQSVKGQRYSLGHRLRASQGGRAVPSNLLTFLGLGGEQCHGRIDQRRDPRDEANGMTVRSGKNPALVPVTVTREDGSKVSRYLWDDGTRRDYPQPEQVAA